MSQNEESVVDATDSYHAILESYGLQYAIDDYFIRVELSDNESFVEIHISAILSQIPKMIKQVIPILKERNLSFVLIKNHVIAKESLYGGLGYSNVGKILTILVPPHGALTEIIVAITKSTEGISGPIVAGEIQLSPVIFTPETNRHIFPDYPIPYYLGEGIKKLVKNRYRPILTLKTDLKGDVYKAVYFKGFLRVGNCIIKQGRDHMWSDKYGRTIVDRLAWQNTLHTELSKFIRVPKIIDFFSENGASWLIMEYISGQPLDRKIAQLYGGKTWGDLNLSVKLEIISLMMEIYRVIDRLHQLGYAHRDITPANFMIHKSGELVLIDLEMCYSVKQDKPAPAFHGGTEGFMSPQQSGGNGADYEDDLFGIAALMIYCFTGLPPTKFIPNDINAIAANVNFFIQNNELSKLIANGVSSSPMQRTSIAEYRNCLDKWANALQRSKEDGTTNSSIDKEKVREILQKAYFGMTADHFVRSGKLFISFSHTDYRVGNLKRGSDESGGLTCMITGNLMTLSHYKSEMPPDSVIQIFSREFQNYKKSYLSRIFQIDPGLMTGKAGAAITLASAIRLGIIPLDEDHLEILSSCFESNASSIELLNGVAGQGVALLQASSLLDSGFVGNKLSEYESIIYANQAADGSFPLNFIVNKKMIPATGLLYGTSGVLYFLIALAGFRGENRLPEALIRALSCLWNNVEKEYFKRSVLNRKAELDGTLMNGVSGVALVFIKAYVLTQDEVYKRYAKTLLTLFPLNELSIDYSLATGLAGHGWVMLQAARGLGDDLYWEKANWIAKVLIHTLKEYQTGAGYWNVDGINEDDSSLLEGNSGVIYFLQEFQDRG